MNDKNKNISNNYKDYKYVYKGYDDFIKKHHLDKKEIKEEKEKIIHDHRLQFDFNNPNQHHHDYSFDFNQNQQQKKENTTYKDKYRNVYSQKPNIKNETSYNNKEFNYKATTTTPNIVNARILKIFFFFFFIIPFIIFIFSIFASFIFESYQPTFHNDVENETNTESTPAYVEPINAFCESITEGTYEPIYSYITKEELNYNNGINWLNIIYTNISNTSTTCSYSKTATQLFDYSLDNLENEFNSKYEKNVNITDAYLFTVKELENNYYQKTYYITVGKINNKWFLIKAQY